MLRVWIGMRMKPILSSLVLILVLSGTNIASPAYAETLPRGIVWSRSGNEDTHIDQKSLSALFTEMEAEQHHDLKGIVVVRNGSLVSEHYFNGDSATTLHDIRSATKSLTSLLVGIAIQEGKIQNVDDSIAIYLPGLPEGGKQKIRIEDLLTMRSGLDADDEDPASPGNEDRLDESSDWIKSIYAVPMKRPPATKYLYCSANAFLAGAIVEDATHMHLDEFARTHLFEPLGISRFNWRHVPIDRTTGQGNLEITARDAAAIGQMMLNDGVVAGKRLVNHDWVARSISNEVPIHDSDPYADFYGYMWYTRDEPLAGGTVTVHFASGNGGNKIYIVPSMHMVVAITSSAYGTRWGQRRSQDILLRILAAASK